jgi:phenylacetate-CoA ligase
MVALHRRLASSIQRSPELELAARYMKSTVPYRYRLGRTFFEWYARFLDAESWSIERTVEYRHQLLVQLLRRLMHEHPVYGEILRGHNPALVASDLACVFPVMTRSSFRETPGQRQLARKLSVASTSGTTGNALQFFHAAEDNQREWAAICHQWRRVGFDPLVSRRAEFRGLVAPGRLVQKFPEYNMLRCSILDLGPESVRHYASVCRESGIEFLHGYPSALDLLARTCLKEGVRFHGIRGIMLASEMVYPHQTDVIEQAFPDARLIAHYGNAERVGLGAWCEAARTYHMLPLYSLIEVQDDGLLVGTNLFNVVNPFLRYRMSDRVTPSGHQVCPACGRYADPLVVAVDGRAEDYLFSPERGWIPPAIITYPLKNLRVVREIQLVQREEDLVELRYSTESDADAAGEISEIAAGLAGILAGVRIVPVRHESLSRGGTGKFRWLVSELDPHTGG